LEIENLPFLGTQSSALNMSKIWIPIDGHDISVHFAPSDGELSPLLLIRATLAFGQIYPSSAPKSSNG
jgi:hypothetical protein